MEELEQGTFHQTGVRIVQQLDKVFKMDQDEYAMCIEKICICPRRKAMKKAETTEAEKTKLWGALGAIGWEV